MPQRDGEVIIDARISDEKIKADIGEASRTIEKESSQFDKTVRNVAIGVGAAFVTAGAAAINFGTDFEQGIAAAATLFGDVDVNTTTLKENILDLSDASGIAADELTGALYTSLSAGIPITEDSAEATDFLRKNTELAKGGFTDIETAVSATAKVLNAYGLDVSETDRIHKILIQTQNAGITTVDELGSVLANVTPTAAAAGVSFEEVGASLAIMTAQGTPTAQATTQLNAAIGAFFKPNKDMVDGLVQVIPKLIESGDISGENADRFVDLGKSLDEARQELVSLDKDSETYKEDAKDLKSVIDELEGAQRQVAEGMGVQVLETQGLSGALTLLNDEFDGSVNQMAKALGSTEALKASLAITKGGADEFNETMAQMNTELDVVGMAAETVGDTTQERWNKIVQRGVNLLIRFFEVLEPLISGLLTFLEVILGNEEAFQLFILAITTVIALVVAYNIQQALATGAAGLWTTVSGIATAATSALGAAFAFLTSPIGIAILAVAAIIAIIVLLRDKWEVIGNFIREKFMVVFEAVSGFVATAGETISNVVSGIVEAFNRVISFLVGTFSTGWEKVWNAAGNIVTTIFDGLISVVKTPLNWIIDQLNKFIKAANKIKIPEWVPGIGGRGINIPLIPQLQRGGLAFDDTLAIVGDNPNAAINPEVIAPLDQLQSIMFNAMRDDSAVMGKSFNIKNELMATVEMDGFTVGQIVLRNQDETRRFI